MEKTEWMDLELGLEDTIQPSRSSIEAKSGSREVWFMEESRSTEEVSDVSEVWDWLSESSNVESGGWSDERRRDDIVALVQAINSKRRCWRSKELEKVITNL